jgi:NAD(P)-dependent dehydrogenase (short-subunit alcohol dehydrogenase family)
VLAQKLRPESLQFLVFFSSVSGRFGNGGQSDYSAANEFLSKLADELSRSWPGQVVAINWGAWDAGMVSDELRKIYASRQLGMIPLNPGIATLHQELQARRHHPEITLAATVPQLVKLVYGT